jgi:hypothetical protein
MNFKHSEVVAAFLVWIGSIISTYLDESQIKSLGLSEQIIAEKLRLINAQFSSGLITEDQYSKMLMDVLNNQVVRYEQISSKMDKSDNN